jgi:hypothetical protein
MRVFLRIQPVYSRHTHRFSQIWTGTLLVYQNHVQSLLSFWRMIPGPRLQSLAWVLELGSDARKLTSLTPGPAERSFQATLFPWEMYETTEHTGHAHPRINMGRLKGLCVRHTLLHIDTKHGRNLPPTIQPAIQQQHDAALPSLHRTCR